MSELIFRKALLSDKGKIVKILNDAKNFIKKQNIDQWQNGYPNEEIVINDILHGECYVAIDGKDIVGTAVVSFREEPTYKVIYDGNWLTINEPYAVIHRIAVSGNSHGKGIGKFLFQSCEGICRKNNIKSIKIDTHKGNLIMQKTLHNNGYQYCGIIYIISEGDTLRFAYEKTI